MLTQIIDKVAQTATLAKKIEILKAARESNIGKNLDWLFEAATKKYGVTSAGIKKDNISEPVEIEEELEEIKAVLECLEKREFTGSDAIEAIKTATYRLNEEDFTLVMNILDNNLKCGVSFETYETKVMGKKSSAFKVTLARHLEDAKNVDVLDGTWFASRKCDGVRCVCFVDWDKYGSINSEPSVRFFSRQGKEFTTLDNLKPAIIDFLDLHNCLESHLVLDGELCKIDENGDEHFEQIVGECKKKNHTITECCYQLFDWTTKKAWDGIEKPVLKFEDRYQMLKELEQDYLIRKPIGECFCKVLLQEKIRSKEDFERWEKKVEAGNWEGFMLRKDVPFEVGRTKNLLKVKKFHDAEFVVEGIETGTEGMSIAGQGLQQVECTTNLLITYKGNRVSVGSGLSREQRLAWFKHPEAIIGKTICVKYFQESQDKDDKLSLRFPTLKHVYENGRDC